MSTPLHVLCKADPSLEGNVADDKAESSACHQLDQVSVLRYFLANRSGWQVAGDLVPWESPDNSLCWVFVYLYNVVV